MLVLKKKKEQSGNFIERYLNAALVIVMIVMLILYYFVFFRFTFNSISAVKMEAKQLSVDITDLDRRYKMVDSFNRKIRNISINDIKKIEETLPDKITIPDLFVNFEALGLSNSLKLTALSVQEDTKKKSSVSMSATKDSADSQIDGADRAAAVSALKKATINVSYDGGGYNNLKNLITAIENNLRILKINYLSFNPKDGSINLILEAYYLSI